MISSRFCSFARVSLFFTCLAVLIGFAAPVSANVVSLEGKTQSGSKAIAFAQVTLYRATKNSGKPSIPLGSAQTDADGHFEIAYNAPASPKAVLFVIARGGRTSPTGLPNARDQSPIRLMTVLGARPFPDTVVINERTTVASAFAMAQFISGQNIGGKAPGMQNAAGIVQNLVDISSGQVGAVLASPPNGLETSTLATFNTLANLLALCVNQSAQCAPLFQLAAPPGGNAPTDTLQAAQNIAHNPWQNVAPLFDFATAGPAKYHPALRAAPDAWTLALKYVGNGQEFDGPGNMAADRQGNIWITNNYEFNSDPRVPVCGSPLVSKLTPRGFDAPGAPFTGGGVNGAGFGITGDPTGNIWVGNFGFQGKDCNSPPPGNSVSKFAPDGTPLSPSDGFVNGPISSPQATISDQAGNIWIANCGNNTITKYTGGDPNSAQVFAQLGLDKPFDIAIDAQGNAWITSSGNSRVVALSPDGKQLPGSPFTGGGMNRPLGIAVDSLGNKWVANTGMELPCPHTAVPAGGNGITLLKPNGQPARNTSFTGGGMTLPWDIAVDGNDNLWISDFGGQRLAQLCGARSENCPPGKQTGDAISPDSGYTSEALVRNTGVIIDASGNVWLANNWKLVPVQTNPGGDGLVVFIGVAKPVKTPLLGPPRAP